MLARWRSKGQRRTPFLQPVMAGMVCGQSSQGRRLAAENRLCAPWHGRWRLSCACAGASPRVHADPPGRCRPSLQPQRAKWLPASRDTSTPERKLDPSPQADSASCQSYGATSSIPTHQPQKWPSTANGPEPFGTTVPTPRPVLLSGRCPHGVRVQHVEALRRVTPGADEEAAAAHRGAPGAIRKRVRDRIQVAQRVGGWRLVAFGALVGATGVCVGWDGMGSGVWRDVRRACRTRVARHAVDACGQVA